MKNLVSDIINNATKPLDPGIRLHHSYKEVYTTEGFPKSIVQDTIVLSSSYPTTGHKVYVPDKVYEFDFFNEYEGFIEANHLTAVPIEDYADVPTNAYIVDMENMVLYHYKSYEVAVLKTYEHDSNDRSLKLITRH